MIARLDCLLGGPSTSVGHGPRIATSCAAHTDVVQAVARARAAAEAAAKAEGARALAVQEVQEEARAAGAEYEARLKECKATCARKVTVSDPDRTRSPEVTSSRDASQGHSTARATCRASGCVGVRTSVRTRIQTLVGIHEVSSIHL